MHACDRRTLGLEVPLNAGGVWTKPLARRGSAAALAPAVRAAVSGVDTEQLVSVRDIRTLQEIEWTVTARHRFRAVLVVAFAAPAMVLAMVGV